MELIPSISISHGEPVTATQNGYKPLKIKVEYEIFDDLFDIVEYLAKKFNQILVVDIDGIEQNNAQLDLYAELSEITDFWVDAGLRKYEDAIYFLTSGASKIVVGTKTLYNLKEIKRLKDITDDIIFSIDWLDTHVIGYSEELNNIPLTVLMNNIIETNIKNVIFFDLKRTVERDSLNLPVIREISSHLNSHNIKLYIAGGLTKDDLPVIEKENISGAIVSCGNILS